MSPRLDLKALICFICLFASPLCFGCKPEAWATRGPLSAGDSVILEESLGYMLEDPYSIVVGVDSGDLFIGDRGRRSIVQFRRGVGVQSFGQPGQGPGEFIGLSLVFLLGDSVVGGADSQRRLIQLFDVRSGAPLASYPSGGLISSWIETGDKVWFGSPSPEDLSVLGQWSPQDGQMRRTGTLPKILAENLGFFALNASVEIAEDGEGVVVGYGSWNTLFRMNEAGVVEDTLSPPVRKRRGVPPQVLQTQSDPSLKARLESFSNLSQLGRAQDGRLLILHEDQSVEGAPPGVEISSQLYLSTYQESSSTWCVDIPVSGGDIGRPVSWFGEDVLWVLARWLRDGEIRTVLYRYDMSGPLC